VKNFTQVDAEFGRKLSEGLRKHSKGSTIASANLWSASSKQTDPRFYGTNYWFWRLQYSTLHGCL